jgi:hypothetical protein
MPTYWVKNSTGTFDHSIQPEGFGAFASRENKFFLTESPTPPVGEFVVEFPQELFDDYPMADWPDGKKPVGDPFNGKVAYGAEVDKRGRRVIIYTQEQLAQRLEIWRWIAVNLFVPDKERLSGNTEATTKHLADIALISTDTDMRQYIIDNLYYDIF